MIKWEEVKHKEDLLELKKDEFNKLTIPQLRDVLFFKGTEDGTSLTTKKYLPNLWIEWESKLETDWNVVKEYLKVE